MTVDNAQSIDAWTSYWRTGTGVSCFSGHHMALRLTAAGLALEAATPIHDDRRNIQIAWMVDANRPR